MDDKVYKLIELTGTSTNSIEDAVNVALARAGKTIKHLRWFQVVETRGEIDCDRVRHWQVTIKVGFTIDDPEVVAAPKERKAEESITAIGFRVSEVKAPLPKVPATTAVNFARDEL